MATLHPKIVLCMKWGSLYPASYVNVLHSAVRRNVTGDLRFVCLTPEPDGLAEGIEAFPIPDLGYGPDHWRHGAWPKLSVFVPDLYGLKGRALFIDLDSVVAGPLDPMFELSGFQAIGGGPDWRPGRVPDDPRLLTGVFSFELGAHSHIVDAFAKDPDKALSTCRIEQRFVEQQIKDWEPWPAEWVISFKRHLRQPILLDRFRPPKSPPKSARIVAFHGDPRPAALLRPGRARWDRLPHMGHGQVDWMVDYWTRNGGRID